MSSVRWFLTVQLVKNFNEGEIYVKIIVAMYSSHFSMHQYPVKYV